MEAKKRLARTITAGFHGEDEAARGRELGTDVPAEGRTLEVGRHPLLSEWASVPRLR
jgi:hypothetical protein